MGKVVNSVIGGVVAFMVIAYILNMWGILSGWLGPTALQDTVTNGLNYLKGESQ